MLSFVEYLCEVHSLDNPGLERWQVTVNGEPLAEAARLAAATGRQATWNSALLMLMEHADEIESGLVIRRSCGCRLLLEFAEQEDPEAALL